MRIALVSEHANPLATLGGADAGGQNVHVAALAAGLARRGHDVTVYTRRDHARAEMRQLAPDGYAVELVPAGPPTVLPKDELLPHMPDFADHLARRWQQDPVDLVHAHFWMSGLAALSAGRRTGIPVLQTFHALGTVKRRHQGPADTSPPTRIQREKRLCREVDRIIATCRDEVSELEAMGMPAGKAEVIPCGVDISLFQPVPALPRQRGHKHRLLTIGRLVPRKGVEDLLEALAHVPDTELVVAGGPAKGDLDQDPEVQRLHDIAEHLGVLDRVRFVGAVPREEVPGLMCSSELVVCVPWYEPFGIVPVEAMACGRPVVGSAVGGLLDTVLPGVTGELVPPRRPDLLAEQLKALLADDARRREYGAAAVEHANRNYRWSQVVARTEAVYNRVLHRYGQPADRTAVAR